jgi:hypothetical protein
MMKPVPKSANDNAEDSAIVQPSFNIQNNI